MAGNPKLFVRPANFLDWWRLLPNTGLMPRMRSTIGPISAWDSRFPPLIATTAWLSVNRMLAKRWAGVGVGSGTAYC